MDKIKDIIRAEIERRMIQFKKEKDQQGASQIDKLSLGGRIAICKELLAFIDSLKAEEKSPMEILAEKCPQEEIDPKIAQCIADHWWEMIGEETSTDLEEEIDKTVSECTDGYNFDWDKFALHFYELGKNSK